MLAVTRFIDASITRWAVRYPLRNAASSPITSGGVFAMMSSSFCLTVSSAVR